MPLGDECLIGQFHRRTRGEHGVDDNQRLVVEARAGDVLNVHHKVVGLGEVLAIGAHKGIVGAIEVTQESLVERQSGTQDGGEHHAVVDYASLFHAQRRLDLHLAIAQALGDFVGHDLSQTVDVSAEAQTLLLQYFVAHFAHELTHKRVLFTQIDNFHRYIYLV